MHTRNTHIANTHAHKFAHGTVSHTAMPTITIARRLAFHHVTRENNGGNRSSTQRTYIRPLAGLNRYNLQRNILWNQLHATVEELLGVVRIGTCRAQEGSVRLRCACTCMCECARVCVSV